MKCPVRDNKSWNFAVIRRKVLSVKAFNIRKLVSSVLWWGTGAYCLITSILCMAPFAFGYDPKAHSLLMFIRFVQPMLIFPCFLVALVPKRWASIPIWLVCLSVATFPFFLNAKEKMLLAYSAAPVNWQDVRQISAIVVIPLLVQFAIWLEMLSQHR